MRRLVVAVLVCGIVGVVPSASAGGDPDLTVPVEQLDAALTCPDAFAGHYQPVLLVHGTGVRPEESWSWNWMRALPAAGFDVCWVRLPNRALDDIQTSAEYVVHAVREIAARTGSKVDVMGHSQGGLLPRWALRWWPSLRDLVDDVVMLATPNHGTVSVMPLHWCTGACHQMKIGSMFLDALNSHDEAPAGPSYTSIHSMFDQLVQPWWSAEVDGASNILIQDVCPGRPVDHALIAADAVTYHLAMDAFVHAGPADPTRVPITACAETSMPSTDPRPGIAAVANAFVTQDAPTFDYSDREPPLREYAQP